MKIGFGFCLIFLFWILTPLSLRANCTVEMKMDDVIGPATFDSLQRAKEKSLKDHCSSLLVLINTPGGSLQSTRKIVEEILSSPVPILCLVSPSGGHAGSAGAIILQACHVSGAMVATNIGAATPISGLGQEMPKDLRNKLINDTKSWLDGLTHLRGRSQKFGRDIIETAKAVSAEEAFRLKAIDFVAEKKTDFLEFAQGRRVKLTESQTTEVQVGDLYEFQPGLREKILSLTTDPQTAYLMFMGSLGLLYFEITHPGMVAPGVIGGIGLILSLVSLHKLDVMWGGLLLILLAISLMIAEAFVPSFGVLGVGGIVSFVLGSVFLFDTENTGVMLPYSLLIGTSLILGLITFGIAYLAFSTRNIKKRNDMTSLVGKTIVVTKVNARNGKKGQGRVDGEIWQIRSTEDLILDQELIVSSVNGFTLNVKGD